MSSIQDFELAALAAGFTIGFGILTVWEAIKQTRMNRNPLRSVYIYMVWGEIFANTMIAVIAWLFLHGKLGPTVPVLFSILFFWVFEIQLLMQIIINRIALIAEDRKMVRNIMWGTVAIITSINIAVFVIWIPAHTVPAVNQTFVKVNIVWDKITKVMILIVDAGLNWYFLRIVQVRLLQQHGLMKYKPLVGFNTKLMILSVGMDALIIGLMFLHNPVVYVQFHPLVYMVKLNIEMSMASLVVRLARGKSQNDVDLEAICVTSDMKSQGQHNRPQHAEWQDEAPKAQTMSLQRKVSIMSPSKNAGIERCTEVNVVVEKIEHKAPGSERSSNDIEVSPFGDEIPLRNEGVQMMHKQL